MAMEIVSDHRNVVAPAPILAELKKLLDEVGSMCIAVDHVAGQQPSDEVMAGALYAIQACIQKQDRLLAQVDEQIKKLEEVSHG